MNFINLKHSQNLHQSLEQQKAMFNLRQRYEQNVYRNWTPRYGPEKKLEKWIDMYFPHMFDDVILTNSYTSNEIHKAEICHALDIGLIIDDNKAICDKCIETGVRALNFIGDDDEILSVV